MAIPTLIHTSERHYFDEQARQATIEPVTPELLQRYAYPGTLFPRELMYRIMGSLEGKTVLDVGCGEGQDALTLSMLGADVTAFDISAGAIEVAQKRFDLHGRTANIFVSSIEDFPSDIGTYDIVFVEALLHHVIHDLDNVIAKLKSFVAPGGKLVFSEPVARIPELRQLRLLCGPEPVGTPDERPLEPTELEIMEDHLPGLEFRSFYFLMKAKRWVLPTGILETAAPWRQRATYGLAWLDSVLLNVPGLNRLGGVNVMWWTRSQADSVSDSYGHAGVLDES